MTAIFLVSAWNKVIYATETETYMAAHGMIWTGFLRWAAIVLEGLGSLFLLLGYPARLGALLLILFTGVATVIFHTDFSDPVQQIMFLKNLAMIGGLLMIVRYGAGDWAISPRQIQKWIGR
jgi:putative oxidoreductase